MGPLVGAPDVRADYQNPADTSEGRASQSRGDDFLVIRVGR